MNNKGHFLIYEAVFTIIILALIITSITTVKQQENTAYENTNHYKKPVEMMELLSNSRYKDGYLLDKLVDTTDNNQNNTQILTTINNTLKNAQYDYTLTDQTQNNTTTLLEKKTQNTRNTYSSQKIIKNHTITLKYHI